MCPQANTSVQRELGIQGILIKDPTTKRQTKIPTMETPALGIMDEIQKWTFP